VIKPQVEPAVTAIPIEAVVMSQEILKSDTVESFSMVESPTTVDASSDSATQPAIEASTPAPAAPAIPAAVAEQAKPVPVRPAAVGNTGSLFFTADADTPSSVTRHLFEPMPATAPAAVPETSEEQELPLLAGNDELTDQENKQDSERSA
ncbi:MAG: hypothetical protein ABIP44_07070, partial [Pseudoxanthomonas sp.]